MAQHTQAVLNLSAAVEAGAARVLGHCQTFQQLFQPRRMSEIGLTDQFMIGAKAQAGTALVMDWMNAENTSGADMVFTSGGVTYVFQAKVAERVGTQLSADFLYESTIKVNGQTVTNFQAVLLADYAASINGRAYYVVYDYTGVYWVNATALKNYLMNNAGPTNQGAWHLARNNLLAVY